ncbi:MAG: single-stranded DNA-binding protein [Armatimonadota bacterium]|nr:single-stranded DNA-binding protein [Armatimonadota bacterium]
MSSINRIVVTGRLTRDPELRTTTTGKQVAALGIAVDKRFKPQDANEPTADFFNVTAWGQTAEFISNYGGKGRLVAVDGRLQSRKYTNKDGVEVTAVEIVAENISLLDRPKDGGGEPAAAAAPATAGEVEGDDYDPFGDE